MFYRVSGDNFLGTGEGWPDDHYTREAISDQPFGFVAAGYSWQRQNNWLPSYSLGVRCMYVFNDSSIRFHRSILNTRI